MEKYKTENASITKPFLRWAGGKSWLVKYLKHVKSYTFDNYHEAFLGGGATFFYLEPKNISYLSDLNGELINAYVSLKDDVEKVISFLKCFKNTEDQYYLIRSTHYSDPFERAAKFIYLNQTSFNGIYRVNLKGQYNVPFGFRSKEFIDETVLRKASKCLLSTNLSQCDFNEIIENVKKNDLVFLDPPYTVSHNTNGFIKYNEKIFSLEDQFRLSVLIDDIKRKDAYYVLTNASHFKVEEIFEKGDQKISLNRANTIGGLNSKRGQTSELLFTNIKLDFTY